MPEENLDIEDPYVYRHRARLRIPKYLVHASGDQFFLPDNSRFYFKDVQVGRCEGEISASRATLTAPEGGTTITPRIV